MNIPTTVAEPENAMPALSSAVAMVVDLLVAEDYDGVEALTRGRRLSADELRTAVAGQGCTLVPLPPAALDALDVVAITDADPPAYSVVVDLWSVEGPSDLSLELRLVEAEAGGYDVEVVTSGRCRPCGRARPRSGWCGGVT